MKRSIGTGLAALAAGGVLSACSSNACCERACRPCCDPCAEVATAPPREAPAPNRWMAAARAHGRGSGAVWSWLAARYDADHDGKITPKEYPRGEKTFARLDRDGDKVLTAADFAGPTHMDEYVAALVLTRIAASLPKPQTEGPAPAAADDEDLPDDVTLQRVVGAIDTDHDGRVREDELDRALAAAQKTPIKGVLDLPAGVRPFPSFTASMDADRSGDLTAAEATAWAAGVRKKEAEEAKEAAKAPHPPAIPEGPKAGEDAPDFTLSSRDGKTTATLSSFKGKKPVALIFGSYTCPPFRKAAPAIRRSYERFGRDVQFFFVYIHEAHSVDGRAPMPAEDQPLVEDPKTIEERTDVARACSVDFGFDAFETLVDGIDDKVARAYVAPPVRLYVVGIDGKIAYKGGRGPFGMDPKGFEDAVAKAAGDAHPSVPHAGAPAMGKPQ